MARPVATEAVVQERLLSLCIPEPMSGCWLWFGPCRDNGYGYMWNGSRKESSHRISYRLFRGELASGSNVLHRCDNPACINPDHLFAGSQRQNLIDCVNKGRHRPYAAKGGQNPKAKLTDEQILEIRAIPRTMGALAKAAPRYGVTRATLCAIRNGRFWKHLP